MGKRHFRERWREALGRARDSKFLADSRWFTAAWFLHNDGNWEKCLDGNYDDNDNGTGPGVTVKGVVDGEY